MRTLYILLFVSFWGVALTAQPVQEDWVALFQAQADSNGGMFFTEVAEANDMAIDNSGNVYVTGRSKPLGTTTYDYVTIKYDASGVEQWVATYAGSGNWDDRSNAIVVDNSGNVYVTGESREAVGAENYVTIKYNGITGAEEWVAIYDGPASNADYARDIAIDDSGNVYVTGLSGGVGTSDDYCTIRYNGLTGAEEWVARYNGAGNTNDAANAITFDGIGNIYVTGRSRESGSLTDFCTIKYNASTGAEEWVAIYDTGSGDTGYVIAVDNSGVYVSGYSNLPTTSNDCVTLKFNAATGAEEWVAIYTSGLSGRYDQIKAIALDASGNVFVTGNTETQSAGYDYLTIKYNGVTGAEEWVSIYNGPANGSDVSYDIALDNLGNAYVTGGDIGPPGNTSNYVTIRYDGSTGAEDWIATYNGLQDTADIASAIAVDGSGNVYVTGLSLDSWIYQNFATIKYSQPIVPVELTSFAAVANNDAVALRWMTATELNNQGFEVERSQNSGVISQKWQRIGYVSGNGTTTEPREYTYTDNNVSSGIYTYRLKQIDYDGTFEYSPEVEIVVSVPEKFTLDQNYPNPFNPSTVIEYAILENGFVVLDVYNLLGEKVASLVNEVQSAGRYEIQFDASGLTSGIYFYSIKSGSYTSIKKMMLLR